jgi:phosphoribosylanthranilate isomerase
MNRIESQAESRSTVIKVCGITDLASAQAAAREGADLLGFHFCSSRRRVTPELVRSIGEGLSTKPALVGVFLNQAEEEIAQIARFVGLDWVQLHGAEAPGLSLPYPLIKALKVRGGAMPDCEPWPDPILLDTWSPDQRGGTGRVWDWALARELAIRRQVIVGGGLTPANVAQAIRDLHPYGVDVSSGVERRQGVKDPDLLRAFVQAVQQA